MRSFIWLTLFLSFGISAIVQKTSSEENELTRSEAAQQSSQLWQDHQTSMVKHFRSAWEKKEFQLGNHAMKFDYKVFGEKPAEGRSLYISMHGGGGAVPEVNDRQWENQKRLYEPAEGVYLAPRAPTNTWNLWHQPHIDTLFDQIIQATVVFLEVNPNRVYLMGYSAGGDGVYQLAPRFADRLAAAAMMAGHPNDASPLGLRNIGFYLAYGSGGCGL